MKLRVPGILFRAAVVLGALVSAPSAHGAQPQAADSLAKPAKAARPNVVLILADDLGYECLGANGGKSYRTPTLDALAAGGMRFEHCYSQPLCTPSRVQLMTGRYNQRNYVRFAQFDSHEETIGEVFRRAGFATCIAGKWQLGGGFDTPGKFGFDEYCLWQLTLHGTHLTSRYPNPGLEQNGKLLDNLRGKYGPDAMSDFVVDFIARHKDRPFFVYYPMLLPHFPHEPTPDSADWDPTAPGLDAEHKKGNAKYFADMVAYTDKMVGNVAAALEKHGLRDNTLIVFTGDNGTHKGIESKFRDGTVIGGKGSMTDAGTHVPLIVNWPGAVPAGKVSRDLIDFSDFLPTLCDICGIDRPTDRQLDGHSFAPQLRGQPGNAREWVYCWYEREGRRNLARQFARTARYKLYDDGRFYDVSTDPLEKQPLSDLKPKDEAAQIRTQLEAVLSKMVPKAEVGRNGQSVRGAMVGSTDHLTSGRSRTRESSISGENRSLTTSATSGRRPESDGSATTIAGDQPQR